MSKYLVWCSAPADYRERIAIDRVTMYRGNDRAPGAICLIETSDPLALSPSEFSRGGTDINIFEILPGWPRGKDERASCGLLVGFTECRDASEQTAFNEWYDNVHAADVIASPLYWRARRYRKVHGAMPTYLALYDTDLAEPQALQQYLRWPERDATMHPSAHVVHVWTFNRVETP